MPKEAQITCRFCKKKIDKSTAFKVGERTYYCDQECYDKQKKKSTHKPQKVTKSGKPNDRRRLTDYIMKLFLENGYEKSQIKWELQTAQLKNIMNEHKDWTNSQIQYVLKYMYEILGLDLFRNESNGSVLSLVPFYFNEASEFCIKSREIKKEVENFNFDDETVIIEKRNINNRSSKEIDISEL